MMRESLTQRQRRKARSLVITDKFHQTLVTFQLLQNFQLLENVVAAGFIKSLPPSPLYPQVSQLYWKYINILSMSEILLIFSGQFLT